VRHHLPPPGRHPLLRLLYAPLAAPLALVLLRGRIVSVVDNDLGMIIVVVTQLLLVQL
jgi:hypothetical protein